MNVVLCKNPAFEVIETVEAIETAQIHNAHYIFNPLTTVEFDLFTIAHVHQAPKPEKWCRFTKKLSADDQKNIFVVFAWVFVLI